MFNGLNSLIPNQNSNNNQNQNNAGQNLQPQINPQINLQPNIQVNPVNVIKEPEARIEPTILHKEFESAASQPAQDKAATTTEKQGVYSWEFPQNVRQNVQVPNQAPAQVQSMVSNIQVSESKPEIKIESKIEVQNENNNNDFEYQQHKQSYHKRPLSSQAIFLIEVEKIKPNPFQPRKNFDEQALKDLANSIREHGILQPLIVSKNESDVETGTAVEYQLIAGERRLRAAKIAGLEKVPVIVRQVDNQSHHLELAIIENLQRENLDSVETARSYARLQDEFGMTQREIATQLGKSREVVANTLRLLSLPTEFQGALSKGQINESQARLLLSIESPIAQKQLFNDILTNNLTVREVRNRVKQIHFGAQPGITDVRMSHPDAQELETRNLEDRIKEALGAEVKIEKKGEAGKIVISFYSPEEIYGIVQKINPHINE